MASFLYNTLDMPSTFSFYPPHSKISSNAQAWELQILPPEQLYSQGKKQTNISVFERQYLCGFGLLAPTTHNTVPQRFYLPPDSPTIELYCDTGYVLPQSDPSARQAMISLGAVYEIIRQAAAAYGYILSWEGTKQVPLPQPTPSVVHIGTIHIDRQHQTFDKYVLERLINRRVVRSEYDVTTPVPPKLREEFTHLQQQYTGIQISCIDSRHDILTLSKLQEDGDRFVLENTNFRQELGHYLRPNNDPLSVGLRGRDMGLDDSFTQKLHEGLLGKGPLLPDQLANIARGGKMGFQSASAIVIISSKDDTAPSWFTTGEAYFAASQLLPQYELEHAVHAAIIEVPWIRAIAQSTFPDMGIPQVIFRIGKPLRKIDAQRPHSVKPLLHEIVLTKKP